MLRQREADLLQRETKKRQAELSRFERDVRRDRGEAVALDVRDNDDDDNDDDDRRSCGTCSLKKHKILRVF
jgi:hypothetical protein